MHKFVEYFLEIDMYTFAILFVGIICVYLYILRNVYLNIFDPIIIFIISNSFAIALVTYMAIDDRMSILDYVFFMLSTILFWVGYYFVHYYYFKDFKVAVVQLVKSSFSDAIIVYIVLLWAFLIVMSFWFFAVRGVPVFAENPSEAKVTMYAGGFGHVRYVQTIFPPIIFYFSLIYFYIKPNNKKSFTVLSAKKLIIFFILATTMIITLSFGSKGALLFILGAISILLFWAKQDNKTLYKKFFRVAILFAGLVGLYFFAILLLTPTSTDNPMFGLFLRLLASGDTFFFYYGFDLSEDFKDDGLLEYIRTVVNPLLAVFRLGEHDYPLGAKLLYYASGFPMSSFGPNAQLPVIADIYFSKYFSLFFMTFMGGLFGFMRVYLIKYLVQFKYGFGLIIYAFIFSNSLTLYSDMYSFISRLLFFFIMVMPFLFLGYLIMLSFKKQPTSTALSNG